MAVTATDGADDSAGEALAAAVYAAVAGFVAILAWAALLSDAAAALGVPTDVGTNAVISTVSTGLSGATIAYFGLRWTDREIDYLDLRRPSVRELLYGVLGAVALLAGATVIGAAFDAFGAETARHGIERRAREGDPGFLLLLAPASLLFTGIGEELVYRPFVQKRLEAAFSDVGALLLTSVVFALAHLPTYALGGASPTAVAGSLATVFFLATVLGVLYLRTRALFVPALAHGAYDAAVILSLYWQVAAV